MLNFSICASLVTALITGTPTNAPAPVAWSDANLRISHAAEVVAQDNGLCCLQTEDGNIWSVYGTLDASRLYAVVFDTCGTGNIEDDRVLMAVAMD